MGNLESKKIKRDSKSHSSLEVVKNLTNIETPNSTALSKNILHKETNVFKSFDCLSDPIKVRALYNFTPSNPGDLKFKRGDIMYVTSDIKLFWLNATHKKTQESGFIPSNYVVVDDGSPESLDGWFPINRMESEKKLILPGYDEGTYIIRPVTRRGCYALSVRMFDGTNQYYVVKHYKINVLPNGNCGIGSKNKFINIKSLILYYKRNTDDLCCRLKKPFPKLYKPCIPFRAIEVNRNCIQLDKLIGRGNFGNVWLAKWNNTVTVAVKTLKGNSLDESQRKALLDEARLMHKLHHPKIVEILGICSEPMNEPVLLITEFMSKGTLLGYLSIAEGKQLVFKDLVLMMTQIADGMSYLESENFIHRDLRAANILVTDDLTVKVADFGLAIVMEGISDPTEMNFPVRWTAPEAGLRHKFTIKSDVWSYGVLLYEIVTYGQMPYADLQLRDIIILVDRGMRLERPTGDGIECPIELYDIMRSCWDANPDSRPTFSHLKDLFENYWIYVEQKYDATNAAI